MSQFPSPSPSPNPHPLPPIPPDSPTIKHSPATFPSSSSSSSSSLHQAKNTDEDRAAFPARTTDKEVVLPARMAVTEFIRSPAYPPPPPPPPPPQSPATRSLLPPLPPTPPRGAMAGGEKGGGFHGVRDSVWGMRAARIAERERKRKTRSQGGEVLPRALRAGVWGVREEGEESAVEKEEGEEEGGLLGGEESGSESEEEEEEETAMGNEEVVIAAAQRARMNRPRVVEQTQMQTQMQKKERLGGSSGVVVGLGEVARGLGVVLEGNGDGRRVEGKAARVLGEEERVGMRSGVGIALDPKERLVDGLRSHPPERAKTVPTRKRAAFSPPPLTDFQPNHRFLRQSIVSTPYPPERKGSSSSNPVGDDGKEDGVSVATAVLMVIVYSNNSVVPQGRRILVPRPRRRRSAGSLQGKEEGKASKKSFKPSFDDEKLFKLIGAEYRRMRGSFRQMVSARTLKSIRVISYRHISHLTARLEKPVSTKSLHTVDDDFAESNLLKLYQRPKQGRGRQDWVDWICRLPENEDNHALLSEKVALELVEAWSADKIVFALAVVLLLSVAAVVLWVFLGIGGQSLGYRDASGKVETGVVLGVLVLLLGWTGVAAWLLLSWLVM